MDGPPPPRTASRANTGCKIMYTTRIQLTNYGPIEHLDIACPFDSDKPKPIVLVGENGSGKSVILSHVVNGLLVAQQVAYPAIPEVAAGQVYKLRSPLYIRSGCTFSFARVEFEDSTHFAELQLSQPRRGYDNAPSGLPGSAAEELWNGMPADDASAFTPSYNDGRIRALLKRNCMLYFPANRFEEPAWLNEDNLRARARHMDLKHIKDHTDRKAINYSPLRDNANWLFDVVYDFSVFERRIPHEFSGRAHAVYDIALEVIRAIIQGSNVRFGIGTRNNRVISVMENDQQRVPNIFQLSSGEVSLLNLFLSILRDFDLCEAPFAKPQDVRGIVLVDEVDLHLHAVHQHDILPKLVQMFPRVQFVLTTHSPLFVLGLRNVLGDNGFSLYQLPQGQEIAPEQFGEFGNAYRVFRQTNTYLTDIEAKVREIERPLVFVDGTTDITYITRAMALLGWHDTLNAIEIRDGGGDGNLKNAWKTLTKMTVVRQAVVLLHDCDSTVAPETSGNVFRRKVSLIEEHPIRRGIENLFSRETLERAMESRPAFVDVVAEHEVTERGQRKRVPERWKINPDEKTNLCKWLCEHGTVDDFLSFDKIHQELNQIAGVMRVVVVENGDRVGTGDP